MMLRFGRVIGVGVGTSSNVRRPTRPVGLLVVAGVSGRKLDAEGKGPASIVNTLAANLIS